MHFFSMGKLKFVIAAFLVFCGLTTSVLADFDKTKWAYSKEIRLEPFSGKRVASFALDNEVFDNSADGLADLRIIDESGVEIPYKLTVESATAARQTYPVRITNLGSKPGEFTQLTLDMGRAGETHNSLTLSTTSSNFRRQVEVEASSDGVSWFLIKKASDGAYIYDYSLDFKAQNTTVNYPDTTYQFLRVRIVDAGEEPLRIGGATIYRNVQQGAREVFFDPDVESGEDSENRASYYILDLEASGIPSNKITFTSQSENYNRQVRIEGSNDKNGWVNIGGVDVIFNYQTPKFVGSKNQINYPESNYRYLKLTVYNRDDQPVKLSDFKVSGVLRKVLFEAESGKKYGLYYGSSGARFAQYDLETFIKYLDTTNPVTGVLGPQIKSNDFRGPEPKQEPLSERYPYLLAGVLGVMVLILGAIVVRMAVAVKKGR